MTTTQTVHHLVRKAKGKALEVKGRATGDRRTTRRGRALRARDGAGLAVRRLGRRLRGASHR